jgi:5-formyltetrahydrofolate cyclo-ligase
METGPDDEEEAIEVSSPPCLSREFDHSIESLGWRGWRRAERARLIALRMARAPGWRQQASRSIAAQLSHLLGDIRGKTISLYWPFRGEPDLRDWAETMRAKDATMLLPVVVAKAEPLIFRAWHRDTRLTPGIWNIPVPAEGEALTPDVVIAPLVGYDPRNYRLGYGGGFFDRSLAALTGPRKVIGVGYRLQAMATIHPQAHDIAMDAIVTEAT